jgi:hypothetical protein
VVKETRKNLYGLQFLFGSALTKETTIDPILNAIQLKGLVLESDREIETAAFLSVRRHWTYFRNLLLATPHTRCFVCRNGVFELEKWEEREAA